MFLPARQSSTPVRSLDTGLSSTASTDANSSRCDDNVDADDDDDDDDEDKVWLSETK